MSPTIDHSRAGAHVPCTSPFVLLLQPCEEKEGEERAEVWLVPPEGGGGVTTVEQADPLSSTFQTFVRL